MKAKALLRAAYAYGIFSMVVGWLDGTLWMFYAGVVLTGIGAVGRDS